MAKSKGAHPNDWNPRPVPQEITFSISGFMPIATRRNNTDDINGKVIDSICKPGRQILDNAVPRAPLARLRALWVLGSPCSSPHQHFYYSYTSFVMVRSRCNDWETFKPVNTSFPVGKGAKLPAWYDWSHWQHWAGNASSKGTRKVQLEWYHHGSNNIRNLFTGFNGIGIRCKGSHLTFPWSAKQPNPKHRFLHVCTPWRIQSPHIHAQTTSVVARQLVS